ncbi:MAG: hypothetical protein JWQ40_18 [Segetibacter sp.]|nr:hypothetical protein [Segetibacter sp.]
MWPCIISLKKYPNRLVSRCITNNISVMYLYFYPIEQLLETIDKNQKVAIGDADFITEEDKRILLKHGVDFRELNIKGQETVFKPV